MMKSIIILDKFLTIREVERANIVNWRVDEVFFISDTDNMLTDINTYDI